ncbi:MAG: DNA-binding response regulator [Gallionellales bacterium 35-53-114]|jgi:two-component system invasion response regulator UvrY|nr:MAG: DNA-binding response regulator [Gallionellales bacterium 35-53-114]OYZ64864.1 MAG: DNA-binding response regulator [Gallionellales bacterium 24-53-125]OZB07598.1 MAG: DNA-binding response regulator [Gallionellales bacterium 39-52-133]HQS58717.1 response regulator transcription factor [Gallionellaceae bacterium]HQS75057.1 response regulator transcription factor [Gallionellaceae bacterium]
MALEQTISVILVDDHPVVRDGYRRLLEQTDNIKVLAEADSGEAAYDLYRRHTPDVVVLDINMPGIGGLETIRRIKAYDEKARILIFSMHGNEIMIQRALEAGALGYLTKQSGMGQMVQAVQQVACGRMYIDAEHVTSLAQHKLSDNAADPVRVLSTREFQLFKMLAEGNSVADIASKLSISAKTVGVHHTNIMKKLGLSNSSQLVRLAILCNVIEP